MKKTIAILAAGTAFGVVAMPAAAQNMGSSDFTGPRVEAIIGYDVSKAGSTSDNDINDQDDESIDGLMYGVGIGYDVDMGGVVVGVEGEYTDSTAKTEYSNGGDFEGFGLGRVDAGRDLYVGARVGAKVSPDLLAYVKGGYTNARYNVLATDGENELDENIDTDGWRLGAGLEYAMSDNMFTKIEYRYSKYSEAEIDFQDLPDSDRFDIDTDRHQVVASVGMRF
ncbi:outer membrane protein [Croceicoccus naphthovorans]|uniref:Membrane protein n=1 Tax=Croceicoccus naphthovorans TaxID=1348774 RepID=A0A0G3XH16_9SPHN|nr:porin family protein [Croceicoccus naphthovorans]AKM09643.1 membrane protein [Croceicoccus naphthovorans]MBB3990762.1 outer membrane immunogenic protein [Croceicoccus naphthovorans]